MAPGYMVVSSRGKFQAIEAEKRGHQTPVGPSKAWFMVYCVGVGGRWSFDPHGGLRNSEAVRGLYMGR